MLTFDHCCLLEDAACIEPLAVLSRFRGDLHACLAALANELPELADSVLCADGLLRDVAGLSLVAEHRRRHGALYDAANCGRFSIGRVRRSLAGLPIPRAADGRLVLAAEHTIRFIKSRLGWNKPVLRAPAADR